MKVSYRLFTSYDPHAFNREDLFIPSTVHRESLKEHL